MSIPEGTHMGRIARLCDQTVTTPAEREESTFRGTTVAPEQGQARVVYMTARPVIVWLSDDAALRALFGRGSRHFRQYRHRYEDFIYTEGGREYVHVSQADAFFGRDQ